MLFVAYAWGDPLSVWRLMVLRTRDQGGSSAVSCRCYASADRLTVHSSSRAGREARAGPIRNVFRHISVLAAYYSTEQCKDIRGRRCYARFSQNTMAASSCKEHVNRHFGSYTFVKNDPVEKGCLLNAATKDFVYISEEYVPVAVSN